MLLLLLWVLWLAAVRVACTVASGGHGAVCRLSLLLRLLLLG